MRLVVLLLMLLAVPVPRLAAEPVVAFRVGDLFEMRVSGVPPEDAQAFVQPYTVGPDGTVNVPLLGEIKAMGLTVPQLEKVLQGRLVAAKIFKEPTVTINIPPAVRMVTVIGEVNNPTRLAWTQDLTLVTAVGVCGGPNEWADLKRVKVVRESKVLGFYNLSDLDKDPAKDPKLLPGDQVSLSKRRIGF